MLDPTIEQQLAALSDEDWSALSARVRPPTSSNQLKEVASQLISGDRLDAFLTIANTKSFAGENGDIDEAKMHRHLRTLFDLPAQPGWQNFGQHTPRPPAGGAGAAGRAEVEKRFGIKADDTTPTAGRGAGGRAEAARRYGKRTQ